MTVLDAGGFTAHLTKKLDTPTSINPLEGEERKGETGCKHKYTTHVEKKKYRFSRVCRFYRKSHDYLTYISTRADLSIPDES